MKRNLLRSRDSHSEERVGFIELFFDLVFVFAVTQVSHAIILHPDPLGFAQAALLFLAIWWVWVDTAWVTNWLDVRHMPVRFLLFALMGAAMVMTIALPQAFGSRALPFALAYARHPARPRTASCCSRCVRHNRDNFLNFVRIIIWSLVEAPFWIAGALIEDVATRMALWGVALAIVSTGPVARLLDAGPRPQRDPDLGRRRPSFLRALRPVHHHRAWRIDPGDRRRLRPDRLGRAGHRRLRQRLRRHHRDVVALFRHRRRARRALLAQDKDPGRMARLAYTYFHIPIVAGIIVTAASDAMAVIHPGGRRISRPSPLCSAGRRSICSAISSSSGPAPIIIRSRTWSGSACSRWPRRSRPP